MVLRMRRYCALADVFLDAILWVDDVSIYTDCAFVVIACIYLTLLNRYCCVRSSPDLLLGAERGNTSICPVSSMLSSSIHRHSVDWMYTNLYETGYAEIVHIWNSSIFTHVIHRDRQTPRTCMHACTHTTHTKAAKELMGLMWVLPTKFVYIYRCKNSGACQMACLYLRRTLLLISLPLLCCQFCFFVQKM